MAARSTASSASSRSQRGSTAEVDRYSARLLDQRNVPDGFRKRPDVAKDERERGRKGCQNSMFDFKWMLSPWIVRVYFVLGSAAIFVTGGVFIGLAISDDQPEKALLGVALALLGPIAVRLLCEWWILFFRINDTLTEMEDTLTNVYTLLYDREEAE